MVEGYLKCLRELLEAHNVFRRIRRLNEKRYLDQEGEDELQTLDMMVTQCMLTAEDRQYIKKTGITIRK